MSIDLKAAMPSTADSAAKAFAASLIAVDEPAGTAGPDTGCSQAATTVDTAHIAWPFSEDTCDCIHVVLALS